MAVHTGVVLFNRSRRDIFQATMYHSIVCKALHGGCLCGEVEQVAVLGATRVERNFRIPPKAYSEVLPEEVLLLPQVQAALKGPRPWLMQATEFVPVERVPTAGDRATKTTSDEKTSRRRKK